VCAVLATGDSAPDSVADYRLEIGMTALRAGNVPDMPIGESELRSIPVR